MDAAGFTNIKIEIDAATGSKEDNSPKEKCVTCSFYEQCPHISQCILQSECTFESTECAFMKFWQEQRHDYSLCARLNVL